MLETHIRGRHQALLANLRAFPPNGTAARGLEPRRRQVRRHATTLYPGRGERSVRVELELTGNTGSNLNNSDNKPRINTYEYIVVYGLNGMVDETQPQLSDWMRVGGQAMYAPLNVMEVTASRWQGHNPHITEANVKAIDMANGGGGSFGRFAGRAPTFRPVGNGDAGRAGLRQRRRRTLRLSAVVPGPGSPGVLPTVAVAASSFACSAADRRRSGRHGRLRSRSAPRPARPRRVGSEGGRHCRTFSSPFGR